MQGIPDMIQFLFITILNMSITASVTIAFVSLARFCLKRAPRGFSYALWAVVLFRLLCPVSFELPISALGALGASPAEETQTSTMQYVIPDFSGEDVLLTGADGTISHTPQDTTTEVELATTENSTTQTTAIFDRVAMLSIAWLAGALVLFGVNFVSLYHLKQTLRHAPRYDLETTDANVTTLIFQSDAIPTAFVLGVLKPRIFLPTHLSTKEQSYVLQHEQTHIARHDPLWQSLAFVALCLHWFNPLVWLAFKANQNDMEVSCDERVPIPLCAKIRRNCNSRRRLPMGIALHPFHLTCRQ